MSVFYRTGVEGLYLAAFRIPPSLAAKNESTRRIVQTLLWFTLALIISVYVTDIQYAISLIGGLAALYIFFFPGEQISYNPELGCSKTDQASPGLARIFHFIFCNFSVRFHIYIVCAV